MKQVHLQTLVQTCLIQSLEVLSGKYWLNYLCSWQVLLKYCCVQLHCLQFKKANDKLERIQRRKDLLDLYKNKYINKMFRSDQTTTYKHPFREQKVDDLRTLQFSRQEHNKSHCLETKVDIFGLELGMLQFKQGFIPSYIAFVYRSVTMMPSGFINSETRNYIIDPNNLWKQSKVLAL